MFDEFAWVTLGKPLPGKNPVPPEWVKACIRRVSETEFKNLNALKPEGGKATTPQLHELLGIGSAYAAVLANPLDGFPAEAPAEVKKIVVELAEATVRSPQLKKLSQSLRKLKPKLRPATLPELQANTEAFTRGATSVSTDDGPAKQELYGLLWFYWPMFNGVHPTRKLLEAVESVTDQKFGWKTFEAVCAEVGIFRGSRGRPRARKFLVS